MDWLKPAFWILPVAFSATVMTEQARGDASEAVSIVVATVGQDDLHAVGPVVEEIRGRVSAKRLVEVRPKMLEGAPKDGELGEARALGRAAFSALAARPPQAVLDEYGSRITSALTQVSAVTDAEGRAVLWNLCALRVHLLISMGEARAENRIREAVTDCKLRFPDRPLLGKGWSPEVARAFETYGAGTAQVPLSIKSAPADCEVRLYGASVGTTPVIVDVTPGVHEVRLACDLYTSALHQVEVTEAKELIIRPQADNAFVQGAGVTWLRYASAADLGHAAQDAAALAGEAGADSILLVVQDSAALARIDWVRLSGSRLGRANVVLNGPAADRAKAVASVFDPPSAVEVAQPAAKPTRRVWKDYVLGFSLIAAGAGLAAYPALAIARDGQCVDADCSSIYNGKGAAGVVSLVGAGLLVASGVTVLSVGPFGKRATVMVGNRITIRGVF